MAEILHLVMVDGSVKHVPFTRAAWYDKDQAIARRWSHPANECSDPVEDVLGRAGVAIVKRVQSHEDLPPPREAILWPPCGELTVELLKELTTLCVDDARLLLRKMWPELPPSNPGPLANKKGQYFLFK